jgi:pimeloyl-ACP methyl ester carboxylesterase
VPLLAAQGHRVLVPCLRGSGPTRCLSSETPRTGRQAAVARDMIALLDALRIEQAILAGFDWEAGWA